MLKDIVKAKNNREAVIEILYIILSIIITTFVLRFTWNNSLSKHVTVIKPIKTFFDALLLSISIQVFRGI